MKLSDIPGSEAIGGWDPELRCGICGGDYSPLGEWDRVDHAAAAGHGVVYDSLTGRTLALCTRRLAEIA